MPKHFHMIGFSLLEVLVAEIIVISVLLRIINMQNLSLQKVYHSYQQSMAIAEANSMFERWRANITSQGRDQEFIAWKQQLSSVLPRGTADYQYFPSTHVYSLKIYWQEKNNQPTDGQILAFNSLL